MMLHMCYMLMHALQTINAMNINMMLQTFCARFMIWNQT